MYHFKEFPGYWRGIREYGNYSFATCIWIKTDMVNDNSNDNKNPYVGGQGFDLIIKFYPGMQSM